MYYNMEIVHTIKRYLIEFQLLSSPFYFGFFSVFPVEIFSFSQPVMYEGIV